MGCSGSKEEKPVLPSKIGRKTAQSGGQAEKNGCYLYCKDEAWHCRWLYLEPEDADCVLSFARPGKTVSTGKYAKPLFEGEENLYSAIGKYLREVCPYGPQIKLLADKAVSIMTHQEGNGIIGDRITKITFGGGGSLMVDGCDCIAAVSTEVAESAAFASRTMSLVAFMKAVPDTMLTIRLDPSGKEPPHLTAKKLVLPKKEEQQEEHTQEEEQEEQQEEQQEEERVVEEEGHEEIH